MADLHFDTTMNSESIMQSLKKIQQGITGVGKVMEEEGKRINTFDSQLLKMCSNLDRYFDKLLIKSEALNSMLQFGKIELEVPSIKSSGYSNEQLEELSAKYVELTEQIKRQKEEIVQQKNAWSDLAETVKSYNVNTEMENKQAPVSSSGMTTQRQSTMGSNESVELGDGTLLNTRNLLVDVREQLIQMYTAGLQNTVQYQQASEELERMGQQMELVNSEMEYLSNSDGNILTLKTGLEGIASSANLVVDVLGLFNQKSEEMEQIQAKVQSLLGIVIGLENTYNTVKKTSILMRATENLQSKAHIAAMALETKAKTGNIALTWAEIAAQKILNMVVAANPYVLLGVAVLSVVGGIWMLTQANKENATEQERANRMVKEAKEIQESYTNAVASNATAQMVSYQKIKNEYNLLGDNLSAKKKFIADNKDAFKDLGLAVSGVSDTEKIFNSQTGAVIDAIMQRAKAVAAMSMAADSYKIMFERMGQLELAKRDQKTLEQMARETAKSQEHDYDSADVLTKKHWRESVSKQFYEQKSNIDTLQKGVDDNEAAGNSWIKTGNIYTNKASSTLKNAGIKSYDNDDNKTINETANLKKEEEKRSEELLALRKNNQQDEINLMENGSKKKIAQIELDYKNEIAAIKKQEKEWSDAQGGKLTDEQSIEISTRYNNVDAKKDKDTDSVKQEQYKFELESMQDYLKEYGTFQQQKLAITEEYAEKIKEAQSDVWKVKSLTMERDTKISGIEAEAIKQNIDWTTVFGEFGGMFDDMIRPALEEAKKYTQTDKFKNSDLESQKTLIDAISQMEKSLGGAGGLNFEKLGKDVQEYQNSFRTLLNAKDEEINAIEKFQKAQDEYERTLKSGTEVEIQAAQSARDIAQQNANTASDNVKNQEEVVNQNQQNMSDTATNLRANMDNVTNGLSKLASGGIRSAYDGFIQISKGMGGSMGKVADKLEDVPIIGWIVSIIDVLKDGLSNLVGGLLDAIFNAVSGILSDVLSGDLFVTIGKSLRDGIGSILNSITFGGWDSWMDKINGSNAKEVQETIDRLTSRNETLEKSIDRLSDIMDKTAGSKSISAYNEAYKYQQERNTNTLQIAREQARYSGSHHSWQYYMDWDNNQIQWARENVDKNFSGTDSLWGLTPEQMRLLLSNADIYDQIKSAGKGGYGSRVMEQLEAYAGNADKLDGLTEKINESIAQISFDSLRDSFIDTLMDMEASSEDFADNFEQYLMKSMLNFSIGDILDVDMKKWYDSWAKTIGGQGGKLTPEQIEQYKKEWDEMVQKGIDKRDEIAALTGYDSSSSSSSSSQESSKKGFDTMSQETGDELSGRFTALQISNEEIKNSMLSMLVSMNVISFTVGNNGITLTEIRNLALSSNAFLSDIAGYQKKIYTDFGHKLESIDGGIKQFNGK